MYNPKISRKEADRDLTFRELKTILESMTDDELDMTATVYTEYPDEFWPIKHIFCTKYTDVLDKNHPYFSTVPNDPGY